MKVLKWLDEHLEETMLVILLVVITIVSFLQVVIRKIPWIPALTWAEEFCRFCWIWSVFLSLPFTIRKGSMLRVTALLDIMPKILRQILNLIVDVVNTGCMGLLAFYSVTVVNDIRLSNEASPAMLWPMWIVYSMMLIGLTLGTFRGAQQFVLHILHFGDDKTKTTAEQAMEDAKEEMEMAKGGNN
ncbi:MAG: TRAP transporter small permease [Clostridiales bacterium]|nr:TRAP transporter small permease [Candidatus Blautia equi]